MAQHTFSFPPEASGLPYVVRDQDGTSVASGTLGTDADVVVLWVDLPWSDVYVARAGAFSAQGEVQEGAQGGGGGGTTETLYLKVSATGADISTEDWGGDGTTYPYTLDPDRTSTGDWWEQTEDGFSIVKQGLFLCSVAGVGTATFDGTPSDIGIDVFDSGSVSSLKTDDGINIGWYSDGSDNSAAFTPQEVTTLPFVTKSSSATVIDDNTQRTAMPVTLVGLVGQNFSTPDITGATLDFEYRIAITRYAAAEYAEADFS